MSSGPQAQYVHYTGPHNPHQNTHQPTTAQGQAQAQAQPPQQQPAAIVAKGNWTKDLVQLAKTAELKKHALTLQLHTAHILSAHASLTQKDRAVEDIREQRNRLESERARLIECLAQVNEDRNQADLLEATLDRERALLKAKIAQLSEGEYRAAKTDVDRLRAELGQPPLPTLQETLDGRGAGSTTANGTGEHIVAAGGEDGGGGQVKRPRGRPRGSRNRGGAPG
ncbi:hypothetical protein B0H14DRAFT_3082972 [Mycena olivaceomarginata]|nr:hypothetical protein B0H14DRAFT_3082972 [Mycena olivaceomarginata]